MCDPDTLFAVVLNCERLTEHKQDAWLRLALNCVIMMRIMCMFLLCAAV